MRSSGPSEGCVPWIKHFQKCRSMFLWVFLVDYRTCALFSIRRPRVLVHLLLDPVFSSKETTWASFGAAPGARCCGAAGRAPGLCRWPGTAGLRRPRPPPCGACCGLGSISPGRVPWQCTVICKLASSL